MLNESSPLCMEHSDRETLFSKKICRILFHVYHIRFLTLILFLISRTCWMRSSPTPDNPLHPTGPQALIKSGETLYTLHNPTWRPPNPPGPPVGSHGLLVNSLAFPCGRRVHLASPPTRRPPPFDPRTTRSPIDVVGPPCGSLV